MLRTLHNMHTINPGSDVRTLGGVRQQVRHEVEGLRRQAAAGRGASVGQARQQQPNRRVTRLHHGAGCQVRACSATSRGGVSTQVSCSVPMAVQPAHQACDHAPYPSQSMLQAGIHAGLNDSVPEEVQVGAGSRA